jgi:hypothetical protein
MGYQGIGEMGNRLDQQACDTANAVLDKMRAALRAATANLSREQRAQAAAELECLITRAVNHPDQMGWRRNDCEKWAQEVLDMLPKFEMIVVRRVAWEYWFGVPKTDWWLEHFAIMITLPNGGGTFYLDDGWWGHCFTDRDVPSYVERFPKP